MVKPAEDAGEVADEAAVKVASQGSEEAMMMVELELNNQQFRGETSA